MEPTNAQGLDALPPTTDLSGDAPTLAINTGLLPSMASHCTRCGAQLAADQRYCVQCGERRGEPRLPFMDGRTAVHQPVAVTDTVVAAAAPPPAPPRSRWSSGATLIAGVGTLLLALGVGVLIGNAGKDDNASAAAATPPVITVQGGGGVAANATDTTATTETNAKADSDKDAKAAKDDKKSADEAQKDAKAVVSAPAGSEIPQAAAPVVKKGQKGSGPGYKDGKFTGDFFGQ